MHLSVYFPPSLAVPWSRAVGRWWWGGGRHLINSRALREILKCFSTLRRVPFSVVSAVVSFFDMLLFFTAPGRASERTAKTCMEACLENMAEVFSPRRGGGGGGGGGGGNGSLTGALLLAGSYWGYEGYQSIWQFLWEKSNRYWETRWET